MSPIRVLADHLAARTDDELRTLLALRPDLALPPVPDFAALAARASTRASLQRALDVLTRPQLQVLEAVVVLAEDDGGAVTRERLTGAFAGSSSEALEPLVADLAHRALIVTTDTGALLPVGALAEALGPYPAGLGRSLRTLARSVPGFGSALIGAVDLLPEVYGTPAPGALTSTAAAQALESLVADPAAWEALLAQAPDGVLPLLSRLLDAPVGSVPASSPGASPSTAVGWLLERCLLAPLDAAHVELPRGVGRALRGHAVFARLDPVPAAGQGTSTRSSLRDNAAFAAIAETLRLMTVLLGMVALTPVTTLRSGGVGVREVRRVREALAVDAGTTAWLLELAAGAGLMSLDPDDSRWKVPGVNAWTALERHEQWLLLVEAWLDLDRAPALVGSRLPDGTAVNVLAAEGSRPDAPAVRRRLLSVAVEFTGLQDLAGPVPMLTEQAVVDLASWHQPRLRRRFVRLLPGMLGELGVMGLTGGGALTEAGRLVAQDRPEEAAHVVRTALPDPVAHVVLQADLTAVAPGYLRPEVARGLARMAAPEGQGPATTYRFSPDSVRAALDAGEDAASILAFLREHSATGIPQTLAYLVEDTASRYGALRVGRAGSYLSTEDDAVIGAVLADPRAELLGLVQVAPSVVVATASAQELADLLRGLGFSPAAVTPLTSAVAPGASAPEPVGSLRPARDRLRPRLNPFSLAEEELSAQLTVLRSGGARPARTRETPASETLLGLETLREAIRSGATIRLGTADSEGNQLRQVLVPLSVSGGRLRVVDPATQVEKVVSVHRVMDVEILEGSTADG